MGRNKYTFFGAKGYSKSDFEGNLINVRCKAEGESLVQADESNFGFFHSKLVPIEASATAFKSERRHM